mmetsp:Transcript_55081/g.96417  ORF Transcript_55081/g.96417 Transcript_55081/m.96417 type:complete len:291 (-) Transcript_55081:499-1371(-)
MKKLGDADQGVALRRVFIVGSLLGKILAAGLLHCGGEQIIEFFIKLLSLKLCCFANVFIKVIGESGAQSLQVLQLLIKLLGLVLGTAEGAAQFARFLGVFLVLVHDLLKVSNKIKKRWPLGILQQQQCTSTILEWDLSDESFDQTSRLGVAARNVLLQVITAIGENLKDLREIADVGQQRIVEWSEVFRCWAEVGLEFKFHIVLELFHEVKLVSRAELFLHEVVELFTTQGIELASAKPAAVRRDEMFANSLFNQSVDRQSRTFTQLVIIDQLPEFKETADRTLLVSNVI